jgi:hypothetical protein
VTGSFEHGNEHSGSIKGEEFIDYLRVIFAKRTLLQVLQGVT